MIAPAIARSSIASDRSVFAQVPARVRLGRAVERAPAGARAGSATDAIELLAARYPVICRLAGDDSFRMTARRYMLSELARSSSRVEFGDTFPQFLRRRGSAAAIE